MHHKREDTQKYITLLMAEQSDKKARVHLALGAKSLPRTKAESLPQHLRGSAREFSLFACPQLVMIVTQLERASVGFLHWA
jgi:hypothetical protein